MTTFAERLHGTKVSKMQSWILLLGSMRRGRPLATECVMHMSCHPGQPLLYYSLVFISRNGMYRALVEYLY
jgi:hypothetical protein